MAFIPNTNSLNIRNLPIDKVTWYPMEGSQELFMQSPFFEVLYHGTRGPGKTDTLLMDFFQDVGKGYGSDWKGILFRQTYPQLIDVIAKSRKWFHKFGGGGKYNASEHFWHWPGGERLYFRQFNKEDDYWNYHGHEYPWQGWEELCNWPDDVGYKRMMSCCRSSNPDVPRKLRSTTNPYGPGHNWVKMRFRLPDTNIPVLDSKDEEGKLEPPRIAIYGSIRENKILLNADPEYIDKIRASARNKAELLAWLYGSWDIVAGGMFDDVWEPRVHSIRPFDIPHNWRIDRSFDWGSSRPFSVGWWAESDGSDVQLKDGTWMSTVPGDLFRINEWYGWSGKPNEGLKMLATDVAKGIVEREIKMGYRTSEGCRVKPGPADSAIFNVENGISIAGDMQKPVRLANGITYPGVGFTHADKRPGSRKTGWEQIRKMLAGAQRPKIGVRETPGLFIFENCVNFLRTVPVLPRDQKDMDDVDTDAEDHIADEVRYRVRSIGNRARAGRTVGHQ